MTTPSWPIVAAGALIAVAILITNHWQIGVAVGQIYRLNRWTGAVVTCNVGQGEGGTTALFVPGTNIPCERP